MYVDEGFSADDMRCQYFLQFVSLEAQACYALHRASQTRCLPGRAGARVREAGSCLVKVSNAATTPQDSKAHPWGTRMGVRRMY